MRTKTPFQIKCVDLLQRTINDFGLKFDLLSFEDGEEESYYIVELKGIKAWIYDDGASITPPHLRSGYIFEELDFENEDKLIEKFIATFLELVKKEVGYFTK